MSRQPKSYVRYGSFILFKKLDESSLGEIWRAAPIDGKSTGPTVGLYRFTGGDTSALRRAAEQAAKNLSSLEGSTVVKKQTYHLVGKNPIITWDYPGGRSLFHMLEVARGGAELPSNPFPVDQALAIADKLALSLETTGNIKSGGQRLHHGALIPQLVWISEDGEVRTLGHQLTKGLLSAMNRPAVQQQFGGFIAPELKRNGESTEPSEVWAVGANLYAMLTSEYLPPPADQKTIDTALSEAILATDDPMPDAVREVLARSLAVDPARRYESPAALREAINSLTQGDEYAPTTFNLAFYIHNLLREEIEQEATEREVEKGVDPSLVPPLGGTLEETAPEPASEEEDGEVAAAAATPPFTAAELPAEAPKRSSRVPIIAAIVILMLLAGGAAAYWFTMGPGAAPSADSTIASTSPDASPASTATQRPAPALEPFVALTDTGDEGSVVETTTETTTASPSEQEMRQKLIQEQIDRRLQEEILKLQAEYDRKLREERDRRNRDEPREATTSAPAKEAAASPQQQPAASKPSPAEELDRQQIESRNTATAGASPTVSTDTAATTTAATPSTTTAAPVPAAPPIPTTKEGDLVDYAELDKTPTLTKRIEPRYPPLAARQKVDATIIVSALVSETGKVVQVKILKGDPRRLGFEEAASEAIRRSTFSPATKDGKRVKTWMPVPVIFKSQ